MGGGRDEGREGSREEQERRKRNRKNERRGVKEGEREREKGGKEEESRESQPQSKEEMHIVLQVISLQYHSIRMTSSVATTNRKRIISYTQDKWCYIYVVAHCT